MCCLCVCDSSASHGWAETCRREELMWHEPTLDTTFLHLKANKTFHAIISWSSLCLHTENWGGTKKFKCACTPTWCYRRLHSHLHTYLMLHYRGPHFYLHTCLMLRYARSQKAYICQAKSICSIAMKTHYSQRNTKSSKRGLVCEFSISREHHEFSKCDEARGRKSVSSEIIYHTRVSRCPVPAFPCFCFWRITIDWIILFEHPVVCVPFYS